MNTSPACLFQPTYHCFILTNGNTHELREIEVNCFRSLRPDQRSLSREAYEEFILTRFFFFFNCRAGKKGKAGLLIQEPINLKDKYVFSFYINKRKLFSHNPGGPDTGRWVSSGAFLLSRWPNSPCVFTGSFLCECASPVSLSVSRFLLYSSVRLSSHPLRDASQDCLFPSQH